MTRLGLKATNFDFVCTQAAYYVIYFVPPVILSLQCRIFHIRWVKKKMQIKCNIFLFVLVVLGSWLYVCCNTGIDSCKLYWMEMVSRISCLPSIGCSSAVQGMSNHGREAFHLE